ncbi:hypothetical protein Trydic_g6543 [Trypoxylus dichotomus]
MYSYVFLLINSYKTSKPPNPSILKQLRDLPGNKSNLSAFLPLHSSRGRTADASWMQAGRIERNRSTLKLATSSVVNRNYRNGESVRLTHKRNNLPLDDYDDFS